jgi:mono/diheme cytochrome c family protein
MQWKLAAMAMACVGLCAISAIGQKPRSVKDGVYTVGQAKRGADAFAAKCAMCHGGDMQGSGQEAPALAGSEFLINWGGKTAGQLFDYMRMSMPPNEQGSLSDQRYADILAAIIQKNGFAAGETELPSDLKALSDILIPRPDTEK